MIREPNAVGGTVELVTLQLHPASGDAKHHRLAVTLAYPDGRGLVRGEMHVLTTALEEPCV